MADEQNLESLIFRFILLSRFILAKNLHLVILVKKLLLPLFEMHTNDLVWYCARTKPKHEHIAAANLRKHLGLEVFHPQLRVERSTRRGLVRSVESLFPCYIFVRCRLHDCLNEIRYTNGISTIVHFADKIPNIPQSVIQELKATFSSDEPILVEERLEAGSEVVLGEGAFMGMNASVLRIMPAGRRVQVLLDILGRPTEVEVDRRYVALQQNSLADLAPFLASAGQAAI